MALQITRVGDLRVAVERPTTASSKPRVMLIHGMFGGAWYWEAYQGLLARHGYESHALDLRGHNGSRPIQDVGRVSVDEYVVDAMAVAHALGNPLVIGHSMGGLIAQKVAEAGACRAVVLMSSAPPRWIPPVSWLLVRKLLKYAPTIAALKPLFPERGDADDLMFNRTPVADRAAFYARLVPESSRAAIEMSFGAVAVQASRVTAPVLVLTGRDDRFVVPRIARKLARKYGATLKEYDSFAHHIMSEPGWERPAGEVVEWLDRHA